MGELVNLKTLKINGNQFVDLPSDFEKLIRLEKLDLGDNQLTTFPEFIVKMKNLKELILENNPGIKTIPVGIFELRKLVYFSLKGTSVKLKEIENLKANLPPDCIIDF